MDILLVVPVTIAVVAQNVIDKFYKKKISFPEQKRTFFNLVTAFTVLISSIVYGTVTNSYGKLHMPTMLCAFVFAISFATTMRTTQRAVYTGPLSLASLATSFSPIVAAAFGIIAMSEPISITLIAGLALLGVSLILINIEKSDRMKFTWWLVVIAALISNGFCSIIQAWHQRSFDMQHGAQLLTFGYFFYFLIESVFLAISKIKKRSLDSIDAVASQKKENVLTVSLAVAKGIANALVNILVIYLVGRLPSSVIFPLVSGGGLVLSFIISLAFFKEKMSRNQCIGFAVGVISIILLNI